MRDTVRFTLNGKPVSLETDPSRKLLWALRTDLELTGTKYGCGEGMCGACTVIVDGQAIRSCQMDLASVQGHSVTTIEGLAANGELSPLQRAFYDHDGYQCGYCTPGQIMSAHALLLKTPKPTRQQIVDGMEGNFCRCGAYQHILAAIEAASGQGRRP
ncbi:MAG TPA: (2Fe-2S)-binding protein [Gemmatimonadales bacterium]|nr:(2Fe-2S)-binding protein [Gemmatimonadales bacterium]